MHESIGRLLECSAGENRDQIAFEAPGRRALSYSALWRQAEYTVRSLNAFGIGRNHRVALVLRNGPELAAAFLGVACASTCAPLNPAYGREEFDYYLSDLEACALVIEHGIPSLAREAAGARGIRIVELSPVPDAEAGVFTLTGDRIPCTTSPGMAHPGDVALVLHTSGTTSRPKIVPLTHRNLCVSARNIRTALELTHSDRVLNVMPLFHIHGLVGAVLSTLDAGGSVVCTPGFDASAFFGLIDGFRPTWFTAVPTMHQALLGLADSNRETIARRPLRFVRSCSAPLAPKLMSALEAAFQAPVIESYGMTEASHQMASNPLPPRVRKPGSVGVAAGMEVAIMAEDGALLPAGEKGEIVIRGDSVTGGYANNAAANEKSFTNGWFRTGDEGFLDPDRYLFITGRIKEIINRGGEKIAPREIDEVIMEHAAVDHAVAFGVPHPTLGEDVAVAVVLRKGAAPTEQEIRDLAFARLAPHKVPSRVLFVDRIPKGPTGKLQRVGLSEKLAAHLKTEFVPPHGPAEERLAGLWAEVLRIERVGSLDNFFMLGGDSLQAARLAARIRDTFGVQLPVNALFRKPTLAAQAAQIEDMLLQEIENMPEEDAQTL